MANKEQPVKSCVNWLRRAEVGERLTDIQGKIKNAQESYYGDEINRLLAEFNDLVRSLNN